MSKAGPCFVELCTVLLYIRGGCIYPESENIPIEVRLPISHEYKYSRIGLRLKLKFIGETQ